MDRAKKLVWSVVMRTDIYSNRPKEIIDTLDLTNKAMMMAPKVAKGLQLQDLSGTGELATLVSAGSKLSITSALSEIGVQIKRYPASFLRSIRSLFARIMQVVVILGRMVKGAPIKNVLIELGILEGSHVLVLGNCRLSDTHGLLVEAEVATKDVELYLRRLSSLKSGHFKKLAVVVAVLWLLTMIFWRDIQDTYEAIVRRLRSAQPEPLDEELPSDSEDNTFSCYICYTNVRSVVFMPCKHYGVCRSCYRTLETDQCPTCKGEIEDVIEVIKKKD